MSITKKQLKFNNQKNKIINKILKLNKKFNDKFLFEEMEKELINFCNGQKYIITIKKINENIKKHKIILSLIKNKKKFFKNLFKKLNKKEKIKKSNITKTIKKSNKKIIEKKENKILAIEYNIDEVKKCSEMQHIINNFGIEINDTEEIINEKDNNYINFICCVFNEKIYELHEKFYNRKKSALPRDPRLGCYYKKILHSLLQEKNDFIDVFLNRKALFKLCLPGSISETDRSLLFNMICLIHWSHFYVT